MPDPTTTSTATDAPGARRRWPLLVIGASAGTATWSGWVGLGELTGFGVVHPLPGIWDDLTLNSAITLPVGVEAYAVYALAVATDHRTRTTRVRRWAWASAFGALLLGMAGQIAYHLLTPNVRPGTPDWIVALVSCLPVLVLGAASLLWHLTGHDDNSPATPAAGASTADAASTPSGSAGTPVRGVGTVPVAVTVIDNPEATASTGPGAVGVAASTAGPRALPRPAAAAQTRPSKPTRITAPVPGPTDEDLLDAVRRATTTGAEPPSIRSLMRDHGIGQARATRIHRTLTATADRAASRAEQPAEPTGQDDEPTAPEQPDQT